MLSLEATRGLPDALTGSRQRWPPRERPGEASGGEPPCRSEQELFPAPAVRVPLVAFLWWIRSTSEPAVWLVLVYPPDLSEHPSFYSAGPNMLVPHRIWLVSALRGTRAIELAPCKRIVRLLRASPTRARHLHPEEAAAARQVDEEAAHEREGIGVGSDGFLASHVGHFTGNRMSDLYLLAHATEEVFHLWRYEPTLPPRAKIHHVLALGTDGVSALRKRRRLRNRGRHQGRVSILLQLGEEIEALVLRRISLKGVAGVQANVPHVVICQGSLLVRGF